MRKREREREREREKERKKHNVSPEPKIYWDKKKIIWRDILREEHHSACNNLMHANVFGVADLYKCKIKLWDNSKIVKFCI